MQKEEAHEVMTPIARIYKIIADLNARVCELERLQKKQDSDIDVPPMSPNSGYGIFDR